MKFCFLANAATVNPNYIDLATLAFSSASVPLVPSAHGLGWGFTGAANIRIQRASYTPIKTSDGAGGGDFTILLHAAPNSSTTRGWLIQGGGASGLQGWSLVQGDNAADSGQAGNIAFLTTDGTGTSGVDSGGATACDGNPHVYAARRSGGTLTLWIDNIQKGNASGLTVRSVAASATFAIGGTTGFTSNTANGPVLAAYGWDRALSDAEVAGISADPYAIFDCPEDDIFAELVGVTSGFTAKFRRTLAPYGDKVGSRQMQRWG